MTAGQTLSEHPWAPQTSAAWIARAASHGGGVGWGVARDLLPQQIQRPRFTAVQSLLPSPRCCLYSDCVPYMASAK